MASIYAVAIDRTGRRIAFAGAGPAIRTQAPDGSGRLDLRSHSGDIYGLAFSPDARHLASASTDGTARIFNVKTGKLERTLRGHAGTVTSVAYSADGTRVVTGGADATIRIWPVEGGATIVLYGHSRAVNVVAFDASGHRVVSTGEDGTVRVWDAAGGEPLVILHQYAIGNGADVSGDGQQVVSQGGEGISNDGVLRVIPCEVCGRFADALALARSRADRTLSATDRQRLLGEQP
jgi:WD40 repeat protein